MLGLDVLQNFRNGLELGKQLEIKALLSAGHHLHRHGQSMSFVESGDDPGDGRATPGIEKLLVKFTIPFFKDLFPGNVVEGHGIGDGAVTVK